MERTCGVKPTRRKPDGHVLDQAAEAMTWSGQCKVCCLLQIVSVSILRPYASDGVMMMSIIPGSPFLYLHCQCCNVTSPLLPSQANLAAMVSRLPIVPEVERGDENPGNEVDHGSPS